MRQYLDLCEDVLNNGIHKGDRTGTGTISVFGRQIRFNLAEGFPLVTTKKVNSDAIIHELLWFRDGGRNLRDLLLRGVNIWNANAFEHYLRRANLNTYYPKDSQKWHVKFREFVQRVKDDADFALYAGDMGPIYGVQWRNFGGVDQLKQVINLIKTDPDNRRLMVNAWNPPEIQWMALPPCHYGFQFYVADGKLSCMVNIRSWDLFLGAPYNIASYALLTMMVAQICNLGLKELIIISGDTHLYLDHLQQIKIQVAREPYPQPNMEIDPTITDIDDFRFEHFNLIGYQCHGPIRGKMAL